ncbi:MAG: hypothetical protein ABJB40_04070 [Acidobacteriota bacterium]
MKKKMILTIATIFVLALGVVAFAYTTTSSTAETAMSCCCCSGDSCPMKKKDASATETASCCDICDCCKGDSCPMKTKGEKAAAVSTDMQNVTVVTSGKSCDCSCCKHKKTAS